MPIYRPSFGHGLKRVHDQFVQHQVEEHEVWLTHQQVLDPFDSVPYGIYPMVLQTQRALELNALSFFVTSY